MKKTVFVIITIYIVLLPYLYLKFFGCLRDYREMLTEVGLAMQEKIVIYYKDQQHYPNLKDAKKLMEEIGCKNIRQEEYMESKHQKGEAYEIRASYSCNYGLIELEYVIGNMDASNTKSYLVRRTFWLNFSKGNSNCYVTFDKYGRSSTRFRCDQYACLTWGH